MNGLLLNVYPRISEVNSNLVARKKLHIEPEKNGREKEEKGEQQK